MIDRVTPLPEDRFSKAIAANAASDVERTVARARDVPIPRMKFQSSRSLIRNLPRKMNLGKRKRDRETERERERERERTLLRSSVIIRS